MPCNCCAASETKLMYSCSGMANTGLLADQVWRRLVREGKGTGTCLEAITERLDSLIAERVKA